MLINRNEYFTIESMLNKLGFQRISGDNDSEKFFSDGNRSVPVLIQSSKPVVRDLTTGEIGFDVKSEAFSSTNNTIVHVFVRNEISDEWLYMAVNSADINPWLRDEEDDKPFSIRQFAIITGYVTGEYPIEEFSLNSAVAQEAVYA